MKVYGVTHRGAVRAENQDTLRYEAAPDGTALLTAAMETDGLHTPAVDMVSLEKFTLALANARCNDLHLRPRLHRHHAIHDHIHALLFDPSPADRTMRDPRSRIEKTEIIIDLRDGSDRGSGILVCRFLIDTDRRT